MPSKRRKRRYPLTGEPPSVRYYLAEPLLRFWFRFVFPSTSYIRHMGADRALRDLIAPTWMPTSATPSSASAGKPSPCSTARKA